MISRWHDYDDGPRPSPALPKSPTYRSWYLMRQRCENAKSTGYEHYGGRGITVCESWRRHFNNFYLDMGERPEGKTLDRIDVNGNYEPSNCRWATRGEQNRNQRPRRKI